MCCIVCSATHSETIQVESSSCCRVYSTDTQFKVWCTREVLPYSPGRSERGMTYRVGVHARLRRAGDETVVDDEDVPQYEDDVSEDERSEQIDV